MKCEKCGAEVNVVFSATRDTRICAAEISSEMVSHAMVSVSTWLMVPFTSRRVVDALRS